MREKLIQERKQLPAEFREQAAKDILQQLINFPEFNNAKNIALYLAVNGEVETKTIIETCWQQNKNVFLPIVQNDMSLLFYQYQKNDILQKNKFGILEPSQDKKNIPTDQLDLVLVPLVGFDENNNRIGMGAGCYDRTFSNKKAKPVLIGLAYAFQKIQITPKEWDVKMDALIIAKN